MNHCFGGFGAGFGLSERGFAGLEEGGGRRDADQFGSGACPAQSLQAVGGCPGQLGIPVEHRR